MVIRKTIALLFSNPGSVLLLVANSPGSYTFFVEGYFKSGYFVRAKPFAFQYSRVAQAIGWVIIGICFIKCGGTRGHRTKHRNAGSSLRVFAVIASWEQPRYSEKYEDYLSIHIIMPIGAHHRRVLARPSGSICSILIHYLTD